MPLNCTRITIEKIRFIISFSEEKIYDYEYNN